MSEVLKVQTRIETMIKKLKDHKTEEAKTLRGCTQ